MTLLLTLFLKSLLVFALAGLLLFALRRSSAAARSLVCLLTLGAVLALPLCALTLPGWHLPMLPVPRGTPSQPVGAQQAAPSPSPLSTATTPIGQSDTRVSEGAASSAPTPVIPAPPLLGAGGPLFLFLLGLLLAAARPLLGLWGIRRLSRACTEIDDAQTLALAADCARLLGLKTPPRLCVAAVPVPMTWGWHRPVIALPAAFADWPEDRLRSVLLHELAHVKRRDWPAHRLADLACAALWFHPLVWLTARRLRSETELACDDLVLAAGISAPDYARHLLEIASALPRTTKRSHTAIAMAQTSKIESRLTMILDKTRPRRPVARRVLVFALVPATAALVTLAVLRPDAKAQTVLPQTAPAQPVSFTAAPGLQPPLRLTFSQVSVSKNTNGETVFSTSPDLKINGTTLFAGATDANKPGSPWWSESGTVLPTPVYKAAFEHPLAVAGATGVRNVVFAFRLPQDVQDVTTIFDAPDSVISSSNGQWPGKMQGQENATEAVLNRTTGGVRTLEVLYGASVSKAKLRVGIGAGPWKVAASRRLSPNVIFNGGGSFVIGEPVETAKGPSLTVSTDTTSDVRVVAVDTQGHEILPNSIGGESVNKLNQITAQFSEPLSQIKEFRVETRPFQWIEFKDVALKPVK